MNGDTVCAGCRGERAEVGGESLRPWPRSDTCGRTAEGVGKASNQHSSEHSSQPDQGGITTHEWSVADMLWTHHVPSLPGDSPKKVWPQKPSGRLWGCQSRMSLWQGLWRDSWVSPLWPPHLPLQHTDAQFCPCVGSNSPMVSWVSHLWGDLEEEGWN